MKNILVILPFSGANVGAGLAIVNQQLTAALAEAGNDVKLLTLSLPANSLPTPEEHGKATIVTVQNDEARRMLQPNKYDDERARLYDIINRLPDDIGAPEEVGLGDWVPDVIIGHSRFSGPAAVKFRDEFFPDAKVLYFVHSIPAEGVIVSGYGVNDASTSADKQAMELKWMQQANVVVPVGPLIRLGVLKMLSEARPKPPTIRVHEFIPGLTMPTATAPSDPPKKNGDVTEFLMIGRAEAPLKGFEDMIIAMMKLRDTKAKIRLRIRGYGKSVETVTTVQKFVDEVLTDQDEMKQRIEVLTLTDTREDLYADIRRADGVLMPSYLEHFGLSPMDGLAFGKPILVNEISGFGMFLDDENRFGKLGAPCVVRDFKAKKRPLTMDEIASPDEEAFDGRPAAWADAMAGLAKNLEARAEEAKKLAQRLTGYAWPHTVEALLASTEDKYAGKVTVQGENGAVMELS